MLPVYILLGPEKGRRNAFINNLRSQLKDCKVSRFYGFEDYESELFAQLLNTDMFCPHYLVLLENADEIKSEAKVSQLVSYIKKPSDNATLVLISDSFSVNSRLTSAVQKPDESIVRFFELFENQKEQWLRDFFRNSGYAISEDAVGTILERVENNQDEFSVVCSQLVSYCKLTGRDRSIDSDVVDEFLLHSRNENVYTLFSYIAAGKTESALECIQVILATAESWQLATVLSTLASCFRRVYSAHKLMAGGVKNEDDALKEKYYPGDRAVTSFREKTIYKAAMKRYDIEDVRRITALLGEYDIRVRESGTSVQKILLERCIVRIMRNKAAEPAEFGFASLLPQTARRKQLSGAGG